MFGYDQVQAAKAVITDRFDMRQEALPRVGIVLGSGLGGFAEHIKPLSKIKSLAYSDIEHFPTSSVEGHSGNLHYGTVNNVPVVAMQGRVHLYEGYPANAVIFPIRVMASLGIKTIIITNAVGAINASFNIGDLMIITDHINMMGDNPLRGPNDERFGKRFFDMTEAYSKRGRALVRAAAEKENIKLREGCLASILGPTYETPAEVRMMRGFGADVAGMSVVFETIGARHMDVEVIGISCVTNMAAGVTGVTLDHSDVQVAAEIAGDGFKRLLSTLIPMV